MQRWGKLRFTDGHMGSYIFISGGNGIPVLKGQGRAGGLPGNDERPSSNKRTGGARLRHKSPNSHDGRESELSIRTDAVNREGRFNPLGEPHQRRITSLQLDHIGQTRVSKQLLRGWSGSPSIDSVEQ